MRRADATARLRAVQASRSPQELTDALDDPSPEVVRAAIGRLTELEGPRAADALRARLLDADLSLVADFANALKRIGARGVVEAATAALGDERYSRRLAAVRALGALGDRRAVAHLRTKLDDDVAGVRAAALDALAQLGDGTSVGADCARLLTDPVPHVRIAAVRAVARLVTHPGEQLASAADDEDRLVRLEVAKHVAGLPEPSAQALLADPNLRVREASAASAGLRQLGVLSVLLIEDPDALVRAAVLHALERLLRRDGAARRLCDELVCERPERRRAAVYALARLNTRERGPELSRLADDPDPDVRLALIHSAEALYDEPQPLMRYLAADSDPGVRQAAEMWLLRAGRH